MRRFVVVVALGLVGCAAELSGLERQVPGARVAAPGKNFCGCDSSVCSDCCSPEHCRCKPTTFARR